MTKREAEDVMEREFGTRETLIARWNWALSARAVAALRKLGGEYARNWGVTRLPPLWKTGRL